MTRSRRLIYLTFSGLVGLVLTLTVTTCGGEKFSQTPTSPSASGQPFDPNAGMVAGHGTCQFSATPASFDDFGPDGGTGEITVTVTGGVVTSDNPYPCTWKARGASWFTLEGVMTGNGLIPAEDNGEVVYHASGTIQFSVPNEEVLDSDPEAFTDAIHCRGYDASEYTINPTTTDISSAGVTGATFTVEVDTPKTREGSIQIWSWDEFDNYEPPSEGGPPQNYIGLFWIDVNQTGSVCSWYTKPINCTYVPNGNGDCPNDSTLNPATLER